MSISLKHRIEYGFLRSIIFIINLLPVPLILWFAGFLGRLAWIVFPFRLDVAYKNLSTVLPGQPEKDRMGILRKTYIQFAQTFGLIFILHRKKMMEQVANAEISGIDKLEKALAQGKGVILTTYHGCWFEAYFAWFNKANIPTSLIYQKQSNPLSDRFFVRQRARYGSALHHLDSGAGMSAYEKALSKNHLLIVSLDQSYSAKGTDIVFFDTPLKCAKGTAVLHMRTKAPVLTSVYYMKDGKLHIDFDTVELPDYQEISEESIRDLTSRAIKKYENHIRKYPEQWFSLFHKLWTKKGYDKVNRNFRDLIFS